MSIRRVVRTSQPQQAVGVDWGNPIARGLVAHSVLPQAFGRAPRAHPIGMVFAPSQSAVTFPGQRAWSFYSGRGLTTLSVAVLAGTANVNRQWGVAAHDGNENAIQFGAGLDYYVANTLLLGTVTYTDYTQTNNPPTAHGVPIGGVLVSALSWERNRTAGQRLFANGRLLDAQDTPDKSPFPTQVLFRANVASGGTTNSDLLAAFTGVWTRALSDGEIRSLSRNPWQLFAPIQRPIFVPAVTIEAVTVYRPGSDIAVNGWTATPGGTLASCIDDATLDRADYITSPNLTDAATLAWASPMPAGTWDITVDADRTGGSGQLRIVLLDAGGTPVGTSAWQSLIGTATTYTLSVTNTATAPNFRIEVQ